jgi:hypothetical protein
MGFLPLNPVLVANCRGYRRCAGKLALGSLSTIHMSNAPSHLFLSTNSIQVYFKRFRISVDFLAYNLTWTRLCDQVLHVRWLSTCMRGRRSCNQHFFILKSLWHDGVEGWLCKNPSPIKFSTAFYFFQCFFGMCLLYQYFTCELSCAVQIAYPTGVTGMGAQLLKVQDNIPICASIIGQKLALAALRAGPEWVLEKVKRLGENRQVLLDALSPLGEGAVKGGEGDSGKRQWGPWVHSHLLWWTDGGEVPPGCQSVNQRSPGACRPWHGLSPSESTLL